MNERRAKRRTKSQRICRKGEAQFVAWATDRRLVANKQDDDYGIDFFCLHMPSIGGGREELSGRNGGAKVRSGARDAKRER